MTRGNLIIQSPAQGLSFYYQINSSAYPREIIPELLKYDGTPESLDLGLEPGQVGNFSYFYELDVTSGTLKVWDSTTYWQNAPKNWKEKGYNCWMGKNGQYGYTNWKKKNRLDILGYTTKPVNPYRGLIKLVENDQFTRDQLKEYSDEHIGCLQYYMKKLRFDPTKVHTWLAACPDYYTPMYEESLDEQALKINSNYTIEKEIANWRLKIAA